MSRKLSVAVIALLAGQALGQSVNLDLSASGGTSPASTYGGVPSQLGTWNVLQASGAGAVLNLVGLNGAASGVTATATTSNGNSSGSLGTGNFGALMNDYAFAFQANSDIEVSLAGLDQGFYRAWVYAALGPNDQTYVDTFGFTNYHSNNISVNVGPVFVASASTSGPTTSNAFQSGRTHAVLNFVVPAGSPVVTVRVSTDLGLSLSKAAFNGLQIMKITATRLYVNDNATGDNTGLSWTDAFTSLQEALSVARASGGQITEIWVAGGVYAPGTSRFSTFELIEGVELYGGFAGVETHLSQRVLGTNTSLLTGNIGNIFTNSDNSYQVVTADGLSINTVMDGFTISGGNANGNVPREAGGGFYAEDSSVWVRNCIFEYNRAQRGGAVVVDQANGIVGPYFDDCTFRFNTAEAEGGAIRYYGGPGGFFAPVLVINRSKFIENVTDGDGGGLFAGGDAWLYNCLFVGNSATNSSGAIRAISAGTDLNLRNCTIVSNFSSNGSGGARADSGARYDVRNSILWGNSGPLAMVIAARNLFSPDGSSSVTYSTVETGGSPLTGSGNRSMTPGFFDYDGPNNIRGDFDDQLWLASPSSSALDAALNSDAPSGTDLAGNPRIVDGNLNGLATVDMGAYELQRSACPGDFNSDAAVDNADFVIFVNAYNEFVCPTPGIPYSCPCDLNFDGVVDQSDFVIFVNAYNDFLCP